MAEDAVAGAVTTPDGAATAEHVCERPSWHCRACGQHWPCAPARAALADGADRVLLAIYMWGHLDRATADLSPRSPAELFDRFLSWTDVELVQA